MSGRKIDQKVIDAIHNLKRFGHSINEIRKITGCGYGTICRYNRGIDVLSRYFKQWSVKRGGSKKIAERNWAMAKEKAFRLIRKLDSTSKLIILACLYWGEGTKKFDLSISNSDPDLIRVFVNCLEQLGIYKDRLRANIRIYEDMNKLHVVNFWIKTIGINKKQVTGVTVLRGKKLGKLKYGLCRLRIIKGAEHLKLILSLIDVIKDRL